MATIGPAVFTFDKQLDALIEQEVQLCLGSGMFVRGRVIAREDRIVTICDEDGAQHYVRIEAIASIKVPQKAERWP